MKSNPIIMSEILEISENSYFRWKKKDHKILINLIEKYFKKEELEEFLETGKIKKIELIKDKSIDEIKSAFVDQHNEKILAQIEKLKRSLL